MSKQYTSNHVVINVLLDVNVIVDALHGKDKPTSLEALYLAAPIIADISSTPNARLIDSDHILDLVQAKLVEILDYSEDDAERVVALLAEVGTATDGTYVSLDEGLQASKRIEQRINGRFLGNGRGQIDHEDLQVLGAAQFALDAADANETALVVTRDGGFHNITRDLAGAGIHVAHTHTASNVLRAAARHA